jgi:predicted nucleotidyltransferase
MILKGNMIALLEIQKLALLNQNRGKIYSWTELFKLTGYTPTTFSTSIPAASQDIDPMWIYTQSFKNYTDFDRALISHYSDPAMFQLGFDCYGVSTKLNLSAHRPQWYEYTKNNQWFWKQKTALTLSQWLRFVPGVRQVILIGSSCFESALQRSDIDLMIQVYPGFALLVRFWIKLCLKLTGTDVHPLYLEIKLILQKSILQLVHFFTRIGLIPSYISKALNYRIEQTNVQIQQYKARVGLKVDVGIFFENHAQLEAYYTKDIAQVSWLWSGYSLTDTDDSHFEPLVYTSAPLYIKLLGPVIWIAFAALSLLAYPLSFLQIIFHRLKNEHNPNFFVHQSLICFVPRYDRNSKWV